MSDIKINDKYVCGDSAFKFTNGDLTITDEYGLITHDGDDVQIEIGSGSVVTKYEDPLTLADDGYIDLPADSTGYGTVIFGAADGLAVGNVEFFWDSSNNVIFADNTADVDDADTDGYFCIFDNTTSVRIKNRLGYSARMIVKYSYTETYVTPTFEIFKTLSGVDNLDTTLTINGTSVDASYVYYGGDATETTWDAAHNGAQLTLQAGTAPTLNDGSPLLGPNDDSVKFNTGGYYKNAGAVNQITTEDFVIEIIFKGSSAGGWPVSTYTTTGYFLIAGVSGISLYINSGAGLVSLSTSTALVANTWYHAICYVNRDENSTSGGWWFVNGIAKGSGQNFSSVGSITSTGFSLGATLTGTSPLDTNLAYIAMWKAADWIAAGTAGKNQVQQVAKERFYKLTGMYPSKSAIRSSDLLVDGNMELADTSAWTANSAAVLSKETTTPHGGSRCLRVKALSGDSSSQARQDILQTNCNYKVTGWYRGDGFGTGLVYVGTTSANIGNSTDWTYFELYMNSGTAAYFLLGNSYGPADRDFYVEYDDVTLESLPDIPSIATRTFSAYLDKIEGDYRKLYYVGYEWLRQCHRKDSSTTNIYGYLPETQAENKITYSEGFAAGWTLYDAGDSVTDNATVCPDGRTAASDFKPDSTNGRHEVRITATLTVATYTFSCYIKKGTATWVNIWDSFSGQGFYYNMATGAIGTTAASTDAYVEGPFYGDFYRLIAVMPGSADLHTLLIRPTDGDGDTDYSTGNGSDVAISLWGAQCELGDYATSPIITSGAAATRIKDELQFVAGDNIGGEDVGQGTAICNILHPNFTPGSGFYRMLFNISDGGASTDYVSAYLNHTNAYLVTQTAASGGSAGLCSVADNCINNSIHEIRTRWETNNLVSSVDGVSGTADTTVDIPDDLDELDIGTSRGGTQQTNGLMSKMRIYSTPTTKG